MNSLRRTHTCGELTPSVSGREVVLNGWVDSRRDHGGLVFVDLRDRYGITQTVVEDEGELLETARTLRMEDVIAVVGTVRERPAEMVNPDRTTGGIEVVIQRIEILNRCKVLPFTLDEAESATDELKFKHRYLHLRTPRMQENLRVRHRTVQAAREHLDEQDFLEVETPLLIRTTPEGARDYVVPSRVHPNMFYALPQSPQLYKQTLMISGVDRYFQLARCLRDEDLRADRQPEHTQIDLEMSFAGEEDVFDLVEGMVATSSCARAARISRRPFLRLSYDDAMDTFGSDKPDLRFDLELTDLSDLAARGEFGVFRSVLEGRRPWSRGAGPRQLGGRAARRSVRSRRSPSATGPRVMAWLKVGDDGITGASRKFFEPAVLEQFAERLGARPGDLLLRDRRRAHAREHRAGPCGWRSGGASATPRRGAALLLGAPLPALREDRRGRLDRHASHVHHARRRAPRRMESDPGKVYATLYDLVCNGVELGSGSVRIHRRDVQERVLRICGVGEDRGRVEVRLVPAGAGVRGAAARRDRSGVGPFRDGSRRGREHPRRDRLPQDHHRDESPRRGAVHGVRSPARGAAPAARSGLTPRSDGRETPEVPFVALRARSGPIGA